MNKENINCQNIEGILCYSPDKANSNEDFPLEKIDIFLKHAKNNFWYLSRARLIINFLRKFTSLAGSLLEIGTGYGINIEYITKMKNSNFVVTASDIYLDQLKILKNKNYNINNYYQLDISNVNFPEEYEVVCAFDVLEHIENDVHAIQNIYDSLKFDGTFIMTVPQHKFLWSKLDEINLHKRRYSRKEILMKLTNAGFRINFISSYVFLLFPFMYLSRIINRVKKSSSTNDAVLLDLEIPIILNKLFNLVMKLEEFLINIGLSLPFGGSLIVIAKKEKE